MMRTLKSGSKLELEVVPTCDLNAAQLRLPKNKPLALPPALTTTVPTNSFATHYLETMPSFPTCEDIRSPQKVQGNGWAIFIRAFNKRP